MPRNFIYTRPQPNMRETLLDFLTRRFSYFTRAEWEVQLEAGRLSVAGNIVHDGARLLEPNDAVAFDPPPRLEPVVDATHLECLYDDDEVVVCVKNGNLPVSEGGRYCANTLVGLLNRRGRAAFGPTPKSWIGCMDASGTRGFAETPRGGENDEGESATRPNAPPEAVVLRPVHRLDKETSGVVVIAKTRPAAARLGRAFASGRAIEKRYVALLVGGAPKGQVYDVDVRLACMAALPSKDFPVVAAAEHQRLRKIKMICVEEATSQGVEGLDRWAKSARTRIRIRDASPRWGISLAEITPQTGRTHQIRLHCAHLGFPILGDKLYSTTKPGQVGGSFAVPDALYLARVRSQEERGEKVWLPDSVSPDWHCARQLLHAAMLTFPHPTPSDPARRLRCAAPAQKWFAGDMQHAEPAAMAALHAMLEGV